MNMPPPQQARPYLNVKSVAKDGTSNVAKEIRDTQYASEDDVVNCGVSCDGAWQKWE